MTTWAEDQKHIATVGKLFDVDHRGAQMEILQDDGVHRHVRFARPKTSIGYFNLVTWPGHLSISGDVESFTFTREHDMFDFFGGRRSRINPHYWAEKCVAGRDQLTSYDQEYARQQVIDYFVDVAKNSGVPRGTGQALRWCLLEDEAFTYEEGAHQLLRDFRHGDLYTAWCTAKEDGKQCAWRCAADDEAEAEREVKEHARKHPCMVTSVMQVPAFEFSDTWEWDLTRWSHHYLYALHAITWGIGKYYARKMMPPRLWAKHGRL